MADRGLLPKVLSHRNQYGAPTYGVIMSAMGVLCLIPFSFAEVVQLLNLLYCLGQIIEFAAFVKLRVSKPDLHRPFVAPGGLAGAFVLSGLPVIFIFIIMSYSSVYTVLLSVCMGMLGGVVHWLLGKAKREKWAEFYDSTLDRSNNLSSRNGNGHTAHIAIVSAYIHGQPENEREPEGGTDEKTPLTQRVIPR